MAYISLQRVKDIIPEYVDTQLAPSAPPKSHWVKGGATFIFLNQVDTMIERYRPIMKVAGVLNENDQIEIEMARGFLNSAFDKQSSLPMFGFTFTKKDVGPIIQLMEKYKDV